MNISIQRKGSRTYARFRDGSKEFHLGSSKASSIRNLQIIWKNHNYSERSTPQELDALIQRINENMRH